MNRKNAKDYIAQNLVATYLLPVYKKCDFRKCVDSRSIKASHLFFFFVVVVAGFCLFVFISFDLYLLLICVEVWFHVKT